MPNCLKHHYYYLQLSSPHSSHHNHSPHYSIHLHHRSFTSLFNLGLSASLSLECGVHKTNHTIRTSYVHAADTSGRHDSSEQRRYPYLAWLRPLQACTPVRPTVLPKTAMEICTPLQLDQWEELLKAHPDKEFVSYITVGIAQGFHIGCNRLNIKLKPCRHNLLSATEYPHVVNEYLANERVQGRIADISN